MKQLLNTFYLFFMICFLSFFQSCEADKEFLEAKDSNRQMKRQITFQKFKQEIGKNSFSNQLSISGSESARTLEEFEIDTTLVKAFETDKVVYSMKLNPKFEVTDGKFYNLVVYKDSLDQIINDIIQFYPQTELLGNNEQEIGYYLQNSLKEIIYSSRVAPVEAPYCLTVDYQYLCYCGDHRQGFCEGFCEDGFRWVPVVIVVYCSSGGGEPDPDPGYGGESGDNGENLVLDPVLPSFEVTPCQKVKNILDNHQVFKQKMQQLATQPQTAIAEKAIALYKDGTDAEFDGADARVYLPNNPAQKYIATAHIHDAVGQGNGTYSVHSLGDFTWLGVTDVINSKVDLDKFVSFLATADGTYYAFTISNKSKFRNFFNYLKFHDPNITNEQRIEYLNVLKKRQIIYKKYYEEDEPHPTNPLIKENGSDNEQDLKNLINFIAEGNFGITVLETDVNFETFSEVKKNTIPNQTSSPLPRVPCN